MVLLREKSFPKIHLKSVPCKWHSSAREKHEAEFEASLKAWEELEARYASEITEAPYVVNRIRLKVRIEEIKASNCAYKVGEVKELSLDHWEFNSKKPKPKVGEVYSNGWYSSVVLEIEDVKVNQGNRKVYPNWDLPCKPEYTRFKPSFPNAVWEMKELIREVCPSAKWEGFWTDYPEIMGYDDVVFTETEEKHLGDVVHQETGTGYRVEVKEDELVLSKFKIERYHFYPSVSVSDSEVGFGSWSDKGYW
jgi:hypothetical protein